MEYLPYIGGVAAIITALGVGKILQMEIKAHRDRKAIKDDLASSNAGKAIDADVHAFDTFAKRLELLETKLDLVHSQLMEQKVENAQLRSDAHHAETELTRQAAEILSLRQRNHNLSDEIQKRDAKLTLLEARILHLEELLTKYQTGGQTINTDEVVNVKLVDQEDKQ